MDGIRRILANLGQAWRGMMVGRYGSDQLTFALLITSFVFLLIANMSRWGIFHFIAFAFLVACYFRIFSRNTYKRYQENQKFLTFWEPIAKSLSGLTGNFQDSKTHSHFRCPQCGQKIRVPRGRGKVSITCPGCHHEFVKKS